MSSATEDYFTTTDADTDDTFKDYLKAIAIVDRPDYSLQQQQQQQQQSHQSMNNGLVSNLKDPTTDHLLIKKCSRCRMKRIHESEIDLHKYQTCAQCRSKRKVKERRPRQLSKLPNVCDDWSKFLSKVALNHQIDLFQHNFRSFSDSNIFPRYKPEELSIPLIQAIGEKIVQIYIGPLQTVTGFKFAIRDHHNPQLTDLYKAKKITWMYICSQDKTRRRKSRSENKRQIINKLKTEDCESKINLSYDIVNGIVQISYNHKHHKPANTFKTSLNEDLYHLPLADIKSIHQQFQELQKQHQLLQTEEEEEESLHRKRFYDTKDPVSVVEATAAAVAIAESSSSTNLTRVRDHNGLVDGGDEVDENISRGDEDSEANENDINSTHGNDPVNVTTPSTDTKIFDAINIGIDNYDDSASSNVDVDVAEIAKLLKQVQQSTTTTSSSTTTTPHTPSLSGSNSQMASSSSIRLGDTNSNQINKALEPQHLGLEEIAALVGLGPEDLTLINDASSYSAHQNLIEQVREQVRRNQFNRDNDDDDDDDGDDDGVNEEDEE